MAGVRSAAHDQDLGRPVRTAHGVVLMAGTAVLCLMTMVAVSFGQLTALTLLALILAPTGWLMVQFYRFMRDTC
jgi:hypothetical protein